MICWFEIFYLNLTPRSSISTVLDSIWTVRLILSAAGGITRSGQRSVWNREFIRVDLPSPLSPATIRVNSKPFFTDFLWTWLGRLANPTQPDVSCWNIVYLQLLAQYYKYKVIQKRVERELFLKNLMFHIYEALGNMMLLKCK